MSVNPSPKLVLQNIGVVIRRLPALEEEIEADTLMLNPLPEEKEEEEEEEEAVKKPAGLPMNGAGVPDATALPPQQAAVGQAPPRANGALPAAAAAAANRALRRGA